MLTKAWRLDKRTSNTESHHTFYIETMKGFSASGYPTNKGFLVKKGAKFSPVINRTISSGNVELRSKLIERNILVEQDGYLILKEDYTFSSPSQASALLVGRSSNGLTDWKLPNGKTLKEVGD